MINTILIAGAKQSGKSSLAKFLLAHELGRNGIIQSFGMTDDGQVATDEGVIDFDSGKNDELFSQSLWPLARKFSFADSLKHVVSVLFGISLDMMYGTDEEKNSFTTIKTESLKILVPDFHSEHEFVTIRQLLQAFGTDICRKLLDDVWIRIVKKEIEEYHSVYPNGIAIIDDCRFTNECIAFKNPESIILGLKRSIEDSSHISENDLDFTDDKLFGLIIDNQELDISDKNNEALEFLVKNRVITSVLQDTKAIKKSKTKAK